MNSRKSIHIFIDILQNPYSSKRDKAYLHFCLIKFTTNDLLRCELLESDKAPLFHWLLHTNFCDLVRWSVVIDIMLKTGFGKKKVHIRDFVNEPTKY